MNRLSRLLAPLASIAVIAAGTTTALAQQGGWLWEYFPAADAAPASVSLHDSETDAGIAHAECGQDRDFGMVRLTIAAKAGVDSDTAATSPASALDMRFSGGGEELLLRSRITMPADGNGMAGVTTTLPLDHALWKMIDRNDAIAAGLPGHVPTILPLTDGHGAIRDFLDTCGQLPQAAQSVPEAPAASGGEVGPTMHDPAAEESVQGAFEFALNLNTIEAWQAFLKVYPDGFYGELAHIYLQKLQNQQEEKAEDAALERAPLSDPAQRHVAVPRAKPHKVKRDKTHHHKLHHKHHHKVHAAHLRHNSLESSGRIRYSCSYLANVCRDKPAGICTLPCF
jgi:hypothetical protein